MSGMFITHSKLKIKVESGLRIFFFKNSGRIRFVSSISYNFVHIWRENSKMYFSKRKDEATKLKKFMISKMLDDYTSAKTLYSSDIVVPPGAIINFPRRTVIALAAEHKSLYKSFFSTTY